MKYILLILSPFFLLTCANEDTDSMDESTKLLKPSAIHIYTQGEKTIDKENETLANLTLVCENPKYNLERTIQIRGWGNTTWGMPKKPYQIEFIDKEGVLGMAKDRKWILLALFSDKTLLRGKIAFDMARMSVMEFTVDSRYVELFLNGRYQGLYLATQKIEESKNRINIGVDGYLLEADVGDKIQPGDIHFNTPKELFKIHDPNVTVGDAKYNFIKNHITTIENVLFNDNFKDPANGYRKYIDVDTFVDYYLINDIVKNSDAGFHTSTFMNYIPGGKLKMGPVWDFDNSIGNINYATCDKIEGFYIKEASGWYNRLLQDPYFKTKVKERFNYFYGIKNELLNKLNQNLTVIKEARIRNFNQWRIIGIYVWPNQFVFNTYDEEVLFLMSWYSDRLEWMRSNINSL